VCARRRSGLSPVRLVVRADGSKKRRGSRDSSRARAPRAARPPPTAHPTTSSLSLSLFFHIKTKTKGGVLGDALAQAAGGAPFSLARNLRLASFGLLWGGPAGHVLHRTLDSKVRLGSPGATVAAKLAIDQLFFAPLSTALLFIFLKCAEGAPEAAFTFLQAHFASTLAKNYAIWPLANALAFSIIPGDLRILFANVVGVLYCAWISASSLGGGGVRGGALPPPPSVVDAVAGLVGGGGGGT
jgi:protein Mpv17